MSIPESITPSTGIKTNSINNQINNKMALYTKEQLKIERSRGLQMSDEENESYGSCLGKTEWSNQQFEEWLSTKQWSEKTKDYHRSIFKGVIYISENGDFTYW